eukprot:2148451-Pleurochrysis_carterae.AAC.1
MSATMRRCLRCAKPCVAAQSDALALPSATDPGALVAQLASEAPTDADIASLHSPRASDPRPNKPWRQLQQLPAPSARFRTPPFPPLR